MHALPDATSRSSSLRRLHRSRLRPRHHHPQHQRLSPLAYEDEPTNCQYSILNVRSLAQSYLILLCLLFQIAKYDEQVVQLGLGSVLCLDCVGQSRFSLKIVSSLPVSARTNVSTHIFRLGSHLVCGFLHLLKLHL
jgi:hypothetical protein